MFATCLFCNSALGANETLEHFPVGRRLAFDSERGRLWVICRQCERWNLSPLETRWEAIEEAERAFRGTRMRIATDNIGLVRMSDGTELVRIGAPPKLEFAAWRYGDQFGKRRRTFLMWTGMTVAAGFAPVVSSLSHVVTLSLLASGLSIFNTATGAYKLQRARRIPLVPVRDQTGNVARLTTVQARAAVFLPNSRTEEWVLALTHSSTEPATGWLKRLGHREQTSAHSQPFQLVGTAAQRALPLLLPHVNADGGNKKRVRDAIEAIDASKSIEHMLRSAPDQSELMQGNFRKGETPILLSQLPPPIRLALEMSLHDETERRAMEGELHELEARWKDADAIAKIADEMFLPINVQEHLRDLQTQNEQGHAR